MFKIKFEWLPSSWGLKGKTFLRAKAEYELTGYELEKRLLEIDREDHTEADYKRLLLDIEYRYGTIPLGDYVQQKVDLMPPGKEKLLEQLKLDRANNRLSDREYEKQMATINEEPWVNIVDMEVAKSRHESTKFEIDWNEYFVKHLRENGYETHPTVPDDEVVNVWFMELCRTVALETYDNTGTFTEDSADALQMAKDNLMGGK